jgi:hypothetical protein
VLKDGKASERWGIFDRMTVMEHLGIMPQQAGAGYHAKT